jgi:hypothetical protein
MLILSGAVTVEQAKKTIRETMPVPTGPLLDVDVGGGPKKPPAPWIPSPLPPEPKPPPPALKQVSTP